MRFNFTLIFTFLFASAVLARRHRGHRHSDSPDRVEKLTHGATEQYTSWAGAALVGNGFTTIGATFQVPVPSGPPNSAASVWVGIDGNTCRDAILQIGVDLIVLGDGTVVYQGWYEWYPEYATNLDIAISAGDQVKLKVVALFATTGFAFIENLTTGQSEMKVLSGNPLCGWDAELIVEDYKKNGQLVPFTNFTSVTLTDVTILSSSGTYSLNNAAALEIEQDGQILAHTSIDDTSVTITYGPE